jgi:DNA-directed RNA polymerase specialized sigma24 family protein
VTKNDAISSIANSKSLKSMAYKFVGSSNYEDLFQEMLLRLLNMPEERIIELQENKQLERYAYGIMTNEAFNPNNKFRKLYEVDIVKIEVTTQKIVDEQQEGIKATLKEIQVAEEKYGFVNDQVIKFERTCDKVLTNVKKDLKQYEAVLAANAYLELGNYRRVSVHTGVNKMTIHRMVRDFKEIANDNSIIKKK